MKMENISYNIDIKSEGGIQAEEDMVIIPRHYCGYIYEGSPTTICDEYNTVTKNMLFMENNGNVGWADSQYGKVICYECKKCKMHHPLHVYPIRATDFCENHNLNIAEIPINEDNSICTIL